MGPSLNEKRSQRNHNDKVSAVLELTSYHSIVFLYSIHNILMIKSHMGIFKLNNRYETNCVWLLINIIYFNLFCLMY